jgi:hypothetical protein
MCYLSIFHYHQITKSNHCIHAARETERERERERESESKSVKDVVLIKFKYFRMRVKNKEYIHQEVNNKLNMEMTATVGVPSYSGGGQSGVVTAGRRKGIS